MRRFVAIALLALAPLAQAFDSAWTQVATVTLDATYIDEAPPIVPIYLSGFDSTWWAAVQADGDDIRVTQDDDTTERDYYLVSINTGTSLGLIVVNVDGYASASIDKDLRVFVGNSGASSASDAAATFADYVAFYMPGMTTSNLANPGTYDLTAYNTPGTSAAAAYEIDAATYAGASSEYHEYSGALTGLTPPITVETIFKPGNFTNSQCLVSLGRGAISNSQTFYHRGDVASDPIRLSIRGNGGLVVDGSKTGATSSVNYYAVGTRTGTSTGTSTAYLDGVAGTADNTAITAFSVDPNLLRIGRDATNVGANYLTADVVVSMISDSARSADYIATMYDAWNTSAFRTYGATASNGGGATGHPWFYWRYRA